MKQKAKKLLCLLCMILVVTTVYGCGSSEAAHTPATEAEEVVVKDNRVSNTTVIEESNQESEEVENETEPVEINNSDFDTKGYLYENTIGDSLYFVVVTNNGKVAVSVYGNGTAKDAEGNVIGADDLSIDVIGPGESSIGCFYFSEVTGIDTVDYQLSYDDSLYYYPVIGNLSVEQNINNENLTVTITNSGKTTAEFVEAYALFFDSSNNVIRYNSTYIVDNDSEIKPGATLSGQLDCYSGYDHVELYLTGRSNGVVTAVTEANVENNDISEILETTEYLYENSIGDSLYFVVVKNISSENYQIGGNATAKDASGNTIGAADLSIDILGPGETSIGYFYFSGVSGIDSVDYSLSTSESYYEPVITNLSVEQSVNNNNVVISVTNNDSMAAQFVEAYALFFDADNNVIQYNSTYVVDNDSEIKSGATLSDQLDSYENFDHVEVYLTGRK